MGYVTLPLDSLGEVLKNTSPFYLTPKQHYVSVLEMKTIEEHFKYWHNNPPAPFNPDYAPTSNKWWSPYCELRRNTLIAKYKELYPQGIIDSEHFNNVRNDILREFVDPFNKQYVQQVKKELNLI